MLRESRDERRTLQQHRTSIQNRLKDVAQKVEKTPRGTQRYVELVTEESEIFKEDTTISEKIIEVEERERQSFESLTHSIYLAHQKENELREQTKYYSIIGTLLGAIIGAIVAYGRVRSVNRVVTTSEETVQECKSIMTDLQLQQTNMQSFVSDIRHFLNHNKGDNLELGKRTEMVSGSVPNGVSRLQGYEDTGLKTNEEDVLSVVKEQGKTLDKEMKEIRKILASRSISNDVEGSVVHEVKELLDETEKNMEWKLKIHALASVTFIYGAIALTLPVVISLFKGS